MTQLLRQYHGSRRDAPTVERQPNLVIITIPPNGYLHDFLQCIIVFAIVFALLSGVVVLCFFDASDPALAAVAIACLFTFTFVPSLAIGASAAYITAGRWLILRLDSTTLALTITGRLRPTTISWPRSRIADLRGDIHGVRLLDSAGRKIGRIQCPARKTRSLIVRTLDLELRLNPQPDQSNSLS